MKRQRPTKLAVFLRHLLAIVVLPITVAGLIPYWIAQKFGIQLEIGSTVGGVLLQLLGLALLGLGLILFLASLRQFVKEGQGTLASWVPPRQFVVNGPYRFVRNPMISGVIMFLLGEALVLLSMRHVVWATCFLALNLVYIPLVEEPGLKRRFGEPYREYCRHVRRFVPRFRPWIPNTEVASGILA